MSVTCVTSKTCGSSQFTGFMSAASSRCHIRQVPTLAANAYCRPSLASGEAGPPPSGLAPLALPPAPLWGAAASMVTSSVTSAPSTAPARKGREPAVEVLIRSRCSSPDITDHDASIGWPRPACPPVLAPLISRGGPSGAGSCASVGRSTVLAREVDHFDQGSRRDCCFRDDDVHAGVAR